jgi:hypothetical protein
MTDHTLADADTIEVEQFYDGGAAQTREDKLAVDRWSKYGHDRLYINAGIPKASKYGLYVDLQTHEIVSDNEGKHSGGDVEINGDEAVITIVEESKVRDKTHKITVSLTGDAFEATPEPRDTDNDTTSGVSRRTATDGDDSEHHQDIVTDGGVDLPSDLSASMVTDRIQQHDDPDHEDSNTVADVVDAWERVHEVLRSGLDEYVEYHDVVYEDRSLVVFATGATHDEQGLAYEEAGVDDEILAAILDGLMHDVAREHCDHDWSVTYPLVVFKSREQTRMETYVRQRLGQLVIERGGAGRGLDYWATKVQGLTFSQWKRDSGRSTGAIGNSIRRGDDHNPHNR